MCKYNPKINISHSCQACKERKQGEISVVLLSQEEFSRLYHDLINLCDMTDFLLEKYHDYEKLLAIQASIHNEPLILHPETIMIKDLETQLECISDHWAEVTLIPLTE